MLQHKAATTLHFGYLIFMQLYVNRVFTSPARATYISIQHKRQNVLASCQFCDVSALTKFITLHQVLPLESFSQGLP